MILNLFLLDGSFVYPASGVTVPMVIEFPPEVSPNQTRKFFTNNDSSLEITITLFAFPFPDQVHVILTYYYIGGNVKSWNHW